jgi:NAD/NADP transhydrogenase beta subunit
MTEATNTVTESGVPPARLGMVVVVALAGFSLAVMGFVMDNVVMIVIGLVLGGSGSTVVNGLAHAVDRWRRPRDR